MKKVIFVVEDEENIRELYKCALPNFEVYAFETGKQMFESLQNVLPDLFLLDLMLPDTSGHAIVSKLKGDVRYACIPVIVVSAKKDEVSKVRLLDGGADDYLTKPFGVMELAARINANLRKSNRNATSFCDIFMDENEHEVKISGIKTQVTLKEFLLLKDLVSNANKTCKREQLLLNVWGINFDGETRTLDAHIKMLRDKLLHSQTQISTVRGVGYILKAKQ